MTPLRGLINCHLARNQTDQAIQAAKSILKIDPLNYYASKTLGELYYQKKDYKSSGAYYSKLARTHPEDLEMANHLAWCYLNIGRPETARTIFADVLAVLPDHYSAKIGYAAADKAAARKGSSRRK